MSIPAHIQAYLESKVAMFQVVDEVLDQWVGDGCLQFQHLMGPVIVKMDWTGKEGEKTARANEPLIRDYVRNHPKWHVTRGAHGGIMRLSDKQKKDQLKSNKEKAKAEVLAAIEAEVARKKAEAAAVVIQPTAVVVPTAPDSSNNVEE